MKTPLPAVAVLSALAVAACATTPPPPSPIQTARFAAPDVSNAIPGEVAVVAAPGQDRALLAPYLEAVSRELAGRGMTLVADGQGAARAEVRVEQAVFAEGQRRGPVTVGAGGSTGSYGGGVGVGIGINLGGRPKDFIATTLGVMIRDGSSGASLWEGRSGWQVRSDADEAADNLAADNLAAALFAGFPEGDSAVIGTE